MKCALIDGDVLLYTAAHASECVNKIVVTDDMDYETTSEREVKRIESESVVSQIYREMQLVSFEETKEIVNTMLQRMVEDTGSDYYKIFLSGGNNFRKQVDPEYKANRVGPKPYYYSELMKYFKDELNAIWDDTLEADDLLAIEMSHSFDDAVICSVDKDLFQVPGEHYNMTSRDTAIVPDFYGSPDSSFKYGFYLFCHQVLAGDPVDNYKGIPKVGTKKADKMLADCYDPVDMWNAVCSNYQERGLSTKYLIQQATLAYIKQLKDEPVDDYIERICSMDRTAA